MPKYPNLFPHHFTLQWHITQRCNWHCKHCYHENNKSQELSLDNLLKVFKQFLALIKHLGTLGPSNARLSITGGEPLVREDLFDLLREIRREDKYFFLNIFTNGSLITEENARNFKSLGVKQVQLSLEGLEKNNDIIRGKGAYQKTMRAVEKLLQLNIAVVISMTLTAKNISDVPMLIKTCKRMGIKGLGIRRLVPIGRGKELIKSMISPVRLRDFYNYIEKEREKTSRHRKKYRDSFIITRGCEEAIFSQETKKILNNCGILDGRALVVLENGDVVPCRRLPVKIGNVLKDDLLNIYYNSEKLRQLRNLNNAHDLCKKCVYFTSCLSGAKCISYAYFNKISVPDPQCWSFFKRLPSMEMFKDIEDKLIKRQRIHPRFLMQGRRK